jgi:hypothetical protein
MLFQRYYPAVGIVILLSLLLAYLLLAVFLCCFFHLLPPPGTIINFFEFDVVILIGLFSCFVVHFAYFIVVYLFLAKSANISTSSIFSEVGNSMIWPFSGYKKYPI